MIFFYICLLLLVSFLVYIFVIEPSRLLETHYFIRKDKKKVLDITSAADLYQGKTSIVLAQISDLHFSRWYPPRKLNRVIKQLLVTKPDMIIFTGDLISNYARWPQRNTKKLIEKLKKLHAPLGKFAILGNHDYAHDGQYFVREVLKKADFQLLVNEQAYFTNDDVSLTIVGLDDALKGRPSYKYQQTFADWHILLTHEPDSVEDIPHIDRFDLVLAGHSHGGQIRLPRYRPTHKGSTKFTHRLYLLAEKTLLSVNTGIGMTAIPARLGVPPTVTYYHLEKEEKAAVLVSKKQGSKPRKKSERV